MYCGTIEADKLFVVPAWLTDRPGPLFYVALPLGYSLQRGNNFASYTAGLTSLDSALVEYQKRIDGGWPLFGVIQVTDSGGKVIERNEEPVTAELVPRKDFGTW